MPSYKRHLALGMGVYLLMIFIFMPPTLSLVRKIELALCTLIGSLFPDIDTKSKIQRFLYTIFFILLLWLGLQGRWYAAALLGTAICLPLLVHHRALFQSLSFIASLCGASYVACYVWAPNFCTLVGVDLVFFFVGAISHLWLDGCKMR